MSLSRKSLGLFASSIFTSLLQFIAVRIYYRTLGVEEYGLFSWFAAFLATANLVTPALAPAAQKRITEALHAKDSAAAFKYQKSALALLAATACIATSVFLAAGLFYSIPQARASRPLLFSMFAATAVAYVLSLWYGLLQALLASEDRFDTQAKAMTVGGILGNLCGIVLVKLYPSPIWIVAANALGIAGAAFYCMIVLRRDRMLAFKPEFGRKEARDLGVLLGKGYPHRLLTGVGNSTDRLLYPYSGRPVGDVANYNIAYRIPEAIQSILYPIVTVVLPKITRESATAREEMARSLDRYGLLVAAMSASVILPLSFSGTPVLGLWLGVVPPGGPQTMALIGVYFTAQLYLMLFTQAYYATGELQYAAVFSGFNALCTVSFTIPCARYFGIVGVAAMNACIGLVQIFPYPAFVKRTCGLPFPVAPHLIRVASMLAVGFTISSSEFWLYQQPLFSRYRWLWLALTPLAMGTTLGTILALGLSPMAREILHKSLRRLRAR